MSHTDPHTALSSEAGRGLTERYVYAATRRLPDDQRADVAAELRGSIADRVDSLLAERPGLDVAGAEHAALVELGDPDRLAAGYTGRVLHLIGPGLYPMYLRVLTSVLVVAVPIAAVVLAAIEAISDGSLGAVIGTAVSTAFAVGVQVAFWITVAFALIERGGPDAREGLELVWSPERLPELPQRRGSLGDLIASLCFLALFAAAIVWQQVRPPVPDGDDRLAVLDPDLWTFWLPLILLLLVVEAAFELVKYRHGSWTVGLAVANTVLGAVFAAPVVWLAGADRLLNPAAVSALQAEWSGFDPGAVNAVIVVVALVIWAWDTGEGWWKALSGGRAADAAPRGR